MKIFGKKQRTVKEYLPIGSVVLLRNGEKKIMIYGRRQLATDGSGEYDYIACLYPEGNIGGEYNFLFNNEDIDKIIFKGFADEEEEEFQKVLKPSRSQTVLTSEGLEKRRPNINEKVFMR